LVIIPATVLQKLFKKGGKEPEVVGCIIL